jgi:hypothetical protein
MAEKCKLRHFIYPMAIRRKRQGLHMQSPRCMVRLFSGIFSTL